VAFDKECVLIRVLGFVFGEVFACSFLLERGFQVLEDFFGPCKDGLRQACEFGHVDTVALVCAAWQDLVQEHDFVGPFTHGHVAVLDVLEEFRQLGEFMIVCGKQGSALNLVGNILCDGPCQGQAIVSASC